MTITTIFKSKWKEFVYLLGGLIFTKKLENFNSILISQELENKVFELLSYDNYKSIKFFLLSLVFFFIGSILIAHNFRYIRNNSIGFGDVTLSSICIILITIFMCNLFICISNPILRAIITLIIGGALLTAND